MAFKFSNIARGTLLNTLSSTGTSIQMSVADAATFASPTGADVQRCVLKDDTTDFELVDIDVNDLSGEMTIIRGLESTTQKEWPAGTIIEQYLSKATLESLQ